MSQKLDPSQFPVLNRWPAKHPDRIQLYTLATPNGVKVSIALEELGLPYEAHRVDIMAGDQFTPEFISVNPNSKIPAIIDPDGPGGKPITLFESGAILTYLAEKTGKLLPTDPAGRYECLQWVFFQVGGVGPMFGQFGFFSRYGGKEIEDPRPRERYQKETQRLLGVLDKRLDGREWIMGDTYTIADIMTFPWVRGLDVHYEATETLGLKDFPNVMAWLQRCVARPASERGLQVPAS